MRHIWLNSLVLAGLAMSCQKHQAKDPATDEKSLKIKMDKAEAFVSQSPAFLDAEIDKRCAAMEDFLKKLQSATFPEIAIAEISCVDTSSIGAQNFKLTFKAAHAETSAEFAMQCSEFSTGVPSCYGRVDSNTNDSSLKQFHEVIWKSAQQFGDKAPTLEARIYGHAYADFVKAVVEKAQTDGIDYQQYKGHEGFQDGDTKLAFTLTADAEGDGTNGTVEFTRIPQVWFDTLATGSTVHILLDCSDVECLKDVRYEIRANQLMVYRPMSSNSGGKWAIVKKFDSSILQGN